MTSPRTGKINKNELKKLTYLKHIPTDGRNVPIEIYYDQKQKKWRYWFVSEGILQELYIKDLYHGVYISSSPVSQYLDYRMPFVDSPRFY